MLRLFEGEDTTGPLEMLLKISLEESGGDEESNEYEWYCCWVSLDVGRVYAFLHRILCRRAHLTFHVQH